MVRLIYDDDFLDALADRAERIITPHEWEVLWSAIDSVPTAMQLWTSVKDAQPPEDGMYFIAYDFDCWRNCVSSRMFKDGKWAGSESYNIKFWMPIPALPGGGQRMNTGKQFEADFKASVPSDAWCYRLKDSAATYYGGNENLSFSIDNICDFLVYRYPMNHLFELKTIETPSIPLEKVFGKYDKAKCKYRKEKHITDMVEAMGYTGQTAHVVVNYRAVNRTFAIPASKVLTFCYNESRKSIPWQWAEQEGIEVKAKRLRVHWQYDVDGLLKRLEKEHETENEIRADD